MFDKFFEVFLPQPQIWKPVKGYEGLYEVSNYGNVRSLDRQTTWYNSLKGGYCTRVFYGKMMTNKLTSDGYEEVHLRGEGRSNYWRVHKLVSEAFHNDLKLPVFDHKDDIKDHNALWNLRRCSVQFNTKKAVKIDPTLSGNNRYSNKISDEIKQETRKLLAEGVGIRKIVNILGISQRSIARIRDNLI